MVVGGGYWWWLLVVVVGGGCWLWLLVVVVHGICSDLFCVLFLLLSHLSWPSYTIGIWGDHSNTLYFDPILGGDPIQSTFRYPKVYILLIPALRIISMRISGILQ